MLGTDVIGCCFLDLLSFKLSSYVSGVSGPGLLRTSSVGAYWIRFSSSCLRLFMEFQGNAWSGRHWLLLVGCASLSSCLRLFMEFRGNAWYGRHFFCSLASHPFKVSSSGHGVAGQCLVRTSLVAAYWIRFPLSDRYAVIYAESKSMTMELRCLPRGASTSSLIIMQLVGETQVVCVG